MIQMVSNLSAAYSPKPIYEIFWPSMWKQNFASGEAFTGKIVMIGPSAAGFQDRHPTPAGTVLGPQLHLNAITAVRHDAFFKTVSPGLDAAFIILLGLCACLAALHGSVPA